MRRMNRRRQVRFPFKGILTLAILVLIGIMVYNSNLLVAIGLRENPIPESLGINPVDPRIVATFDQSLKRNYAKETFDKLYSLLTGELEKGLVQVHAVDSKLDTGISGMTFHIENAVTGALVDTLVTDENGIAESVLLPYQNAYRVIPVKGESLYELYPESVIFEMKSKVMAVTLTHKMPAHVVRYENEGGVIRLEEVFMPVPLILQNPELPNGCEITAMAAVLQHYGYEANHLVLSDDFLPKAPFYRVNGVLYGADPDVAFSGNPRDAHGWYAFAPPTALAANRYLESVNGNHLAKDITGSSRDEIMALVESGKPVAIWVTRKLDLAQIGYSWLLDDNSGRVHEAFINLHCMVIHGFVGDELYVMDPLEGNMRYDKTQFFDAYDSLGQMAIVMEEAEDGL